MLYLLNRPLTRQFQKVALVNCNTPYTSTVYTDVMLELLKVWCTGNTVLMLEYHDMKIYRRNGGKEPCVLITALDRNE